MIDKTQPQRLLESIIPNKAVMEQRWRSHDIERKRQGFTRNKAVQVCSAGDWPDLESQQRYWKERDEHLDRTESNSLWFDNKAKTELPF